MALIVMVTGLLGFLASWILLHTGMDSMTVRYPLAVGIAYLGFLGLLWAWLRTRAEDWSDVPDLSGLLPHSTKEAAVPPLSGEGGDFGGAGASASFDGTPPMATESTLPNLGDAASSALEADEFAAPLLLLMALAAGVLAAAYAIYIAPTLLAELLLDGLLSITLYRHLRHLETQHWLHTAFKRTLLPFGMAALMMAGLGWGTSFVSPGRPLAQRGAARIRRHAPLARKDSRPGGHSAHADERRRSLTPCAASRIGVRCAVQPPCQGGVRPRSGRARRKAQR